MQNKPLRITPGCLAEVIADFYCPENVGRIVTCVRPATAGDCAMWLLPPDTRPWVCEAPDLVSRFFVDRAVERSSRRLLDERNLRPISDPDSYTDEDRLADLNLDKQTPRVLETIECVTI